MRSIFVAGWWYGIVGHLESCDGNENYCRCHNSGELMHFPFDYVYLSFIIFSWIQYYHSFNPCSVLPFKSNLFGVKLSSRSMQKCDLVIGSKHDCEIHMNSVFNITKFPFAYMYLSLNFHLSRQLSSINMRYIINK